MSEQQNKKSKQPAVLGEAVAIPFDAIAPGNAPRNTTADAVDDGTFSYKKIYEKIRSGDTLTDKELIFGRAHFKRLSDWLYALDDTFRLAAGECRRAADALDSYMRARKLGEYGK